MDIAVFSDSHGKVSRMKKVIENCGADVVIFLGDGISDIELIEKTDRRRRIYTYVRGNCDFSFSDVPTVKEFEFECVRFLIMHGHTMNVKYGTELLEKYARSRNADIVLYGHTHTPDNRYLSGENGEKPLYVFNPGSIGDPFSPSFGFIGISNGQIITNYTEYKEGTRI